MAGHINTSGSVEWCTEDKIIKLVHEFFDGPPDLDPCSNPYSRVKATQEFLLENFNDGLLDPWDNYKNIFVNPPFGKGWWRPHPHQNEKCTPKHCVCGCSNRREYIWPAERDELKRRLSKVDYKKILNELERVDIGSWIKRCSSYGNLLNGRHRHNVLALIPAAVGTKAWHRYIWPEAAAVFFPKGRLSFRLVSPTEEKTGPAPNDCAIVYWGTDKFEDFLEVFRPHGKVVIL